MSDNPFLEELRKMQESPDPFTGLVEIKKDFTVDFEDSDPNKSRVVQDLVSGGKDIQVPMTNRTPSATSNPKDRVYLKPTPTEDEGRKDVQYDREYDRPKAKPKVTKKPTEQPDRSIIYMNAARKNKPKMGSSIADKDVDKTIAETHEAPKREESDEGGVMSKKGVPSGSAKENRYSPAEGKSPIEDSPFRHRDEANDDGVSLVQSYLRFNAVSHFQKKIAEARKEIDAAHAKGDTDALEAAQKKKAGLEKKLKEAVDKHVDYEKQAESRTYDSQRPKRGKAKKAEFDAAYEKKWADAKKEYMEGRGMEQWNKVDTPQLRRQVMSEYEDKRRKGLLKMADDLRDSIMENLEKAIDKSLYSDFKDDLVEIVKACMYDEDIHFAELAKAFEEEVAMVNDQEFRKSQMDFEELVKAYNESVEVINRLVDEVSVLKKSIEAEDEEDDFDFGEEEKPKKKKKAYEDEEEEEMEKAGEEVSDPNSDGAAATEPESMSKAGGKGGIDQDTAAKVGNKVLKPGAKQDVTVKGQTEAKKELEKHPNPEIGKSEGEDFEAPYPGATVEAERARPNDLAKMKDQDIGAMDWKDFVKQAGSPKFY